MWPALLEKAFAKVNGNYERINGGSQFETLQFLLNIPSIRYPYSQFNNDTIWATLLDAEKKGFIVGTGTTSGKDTNKCGLDLPCGHAYSILSQHVVVAENGTEYRLVKIKNPHGADGTFNGKWADKNTIWNELGKDGLTYAQQAGLTVASDGIHFLEVYELFKAFVNFDLGQMRKGWVSSYYDK